MTMIAKKYWTDKELLAFPKDGYEREIVNGELIVSPAGCDHGAIIMRIAGPLAVYVNAHDLGLTLDGQTGCRMKNGDLFSPDVSFVSKKRWIKDRKTQKSFFSGSPELVVEVLSPSDTLGVTEEKIAQYFENGAKLAWIVHPRTNRVHIYHGLSADKLLLTPSDTLDGEDIVPGFRLPLKKVLY